MTKLKELIQNQIILEDGSNYLPQAIKLADATWSTAIFRNDETHGGNKGRQLEEILENWNGCLPSGLEAAVSEFYIHKGSLEKLDSEERVISTCSDEQILNMDIEEMVISRAIAKVTVSGNHSEYSNAIAFNMNEKFDQIATGSNVAICDNLTILSFDRMYSTKDKIKPAPEASKSAMKHIMGQLKGYMKESSLELEKAYQQIEKWKNHTISKAKFNEFLGEQFTRIQVANHYRVLRRIKELTEEEKSIPLTGVQLSKIAVEAAKPSHGAYEWHGDETNLWSIINFGTGVLKFQNGSDSVTVLNANREWVSLVDGYFQN